MVLTGLSQIYDQLDDKADMSAVYNFFKDNLNRTQCVVENETQNVQRLVGRGWLDNDEGRLLVQLFEQIQNYNCSQCGMQGHADSQCSIQHSEYDVARRLKLDANLAKFRAAKKAYHQIQVSRQVAESKKKLALDARKLIDANFDAQNPRDDFFGDDVV